jgi:hypothetical protein
MPASLSILTVFERPKSLKVLGNLVECVKIDPIHIGSLNSMAQPP